MHTRAIRNKQKRKPLEKNGNSRHYPRRRQNIDSSIHGIRKRMRQRHEIETRRNSENQIPHRQRGIHRQERQQKMEHAGYSIQRGGTPGTICTARTNDAKPSGIHPGTTSTGTRTTTTTTNAANGIERGRTAAAKLGIPVLNQEGGVKGDNKRKHRER